MTKTRVGGWRTFGVLFGRDIKNLFANPALIMYNAVLPPLLVAVLGSLTRDGYGGAGVTSYDFYGVTLLIFSGLSAGMTSANSFMERRLKASNLRVLYGPVPPSFLYGSKIAATFVFTGVCFGAAAGGLHFAFGVNWGGALWGYFAGVVLLLGLLSSVLGVAVCCIVGGEETANRWLSPFIQGAALLGGLFFPVDGLSEALARLSWLSPAKWAAEAAFRIIYDGDTGLFWPVALSLSAAIGAGLLLCRWTFRTEDYV